TGRWAPVRSPLLASPLLDFLRRTPSSMHANKAFWCGFVMEAFPEIFAFPRGRGNYSPDWRNEYARNSAFVADLIHRESSPLDEVLPPEVLLELLAANAMMIGGYSSIPQRLRRLTGRARMALRAPSGSVPAATGRSF